MNRLVIDVKPGPSRVWIVEWRSFGRVSRWSTKEAALLHATKTAEEHERHGGISQVVVFKRDGQFQEERTYPRSSDPKRYRG